MCALRCTEMPIPTIEDHKLGEIDDLHRAVMGKLTVLRYSENSPRNVADLRQRLQEYADAVVDFANALP